MCGISGIINKYNKTVKKQDIKKINDLISHRGPDDEGYYFKNNFAFGHRRLSILDLSKDGHQPMHYLDKYTITYNGEIYNYIEIKDELLKDGYIFHSHTDTEVILASYDKWGEDCVNKFNGMWAFSIYDKEKNILFCSRDRFGIKPFYYTETDGKFIFGSEIKQLLEFYPNRYVNKNILMDYLIVGFEEHTNETFFENIFKLEQSHNLIFDLNSNEFEIKRYYDIKIDDDIKNISEEEIIKRYKDQLEDSIKLRLRSDVTVGTCLSGGLDSSSVAAIASKLYYKQTNTQFKAIHAKSIEDKTDESYYAKEVAKHCNIDLDIVEPKTEDFLENINEVIYIQEEPFAGPSIFMQYFVMKEAKKLDCKVMLDGQGGDETLFGYETYFQVILATYLKKLNFSKFIKTLKQINNFKISKFKIIVQTILTLFGNIRYKRIIKNSFIKKEYIDNNRLKQHFNFDTIDKFQRNQITRYNLPHLLRYEDKNSMRNSIETRLPFIDYRLVDTTMNINMKHKFKNGYLKYILRKVISSSLTDEIVWRKNKFGFEAPTDIWIAQHKGTMLHTIKKSNILQEIVDFRKVTMHNKVFWKLYNVAKWEEIYNVKICN